MMSRDLPSAAQAAEQAPQQQAVAEGGGDSTAARLTSDHMSYSDPLDAAKVAYDPYNTGAYKVLVERPPRRSLDNMRQLDAEIRRNRKPWA